MCIFFYLLGISSLKFGFEALQRIPGGINSISRHTYKLAKFALLKMMEIRHFNGRNVVKIYNDASRFMNDKIEDQGKMALS